MRSLIVAYTRKYECNVVPGQTFLLLSLPPLGQTILHHLLRKKTAYKNYQTGENNVVKFSWIVEGAYRVLFVSALSFYE